MTPMSKKLAKKFKKTPRREEARQRKEMVLSSKAFRDWWAARRTQSPIPSDPYRAFMTDLALSATMQPRKVWRRKTNRSDMPNVDYPVPYGYKPTKKPRLPSRKGEKRRRKAGKPWIPPPPKLTPMEKELTERAEKFAERYHIPVPKVIAGKGVLRSYYKAGWAAAGYQTSEPIVFIGVGKGAKAQTLAAFYHELGHHAHAWTGYPRTGRVSAKFLGSGKVERERMAWKLADPFMKEQRAIQKWLKKYALGTYTGTTPERRTWV